MSKQTRFLSASLLAQVQEPSAPVRPVCEEHGKVLYSSVKDAREAQVGAMKSRRIRVYECDQHPDRHHVTKEDARHQINEDHGWN